MMYPSKYAIKKASFKQLTKWLAELPEPSNAKEEALMAKIENEAAKGK